MRASGRGNDSLGGGRTPSVRAADELIDCPNIRNASTPIAKPYDDIDWYARSPLRPVPSDDLEAGACCRARTQSESAVTAALTVAPLSAWMRAMTISGFPSGGEDGMKSRQMVAST